MQCIVCDGRRFVTRYRGPLISGYRLAECRSCGMVLAFDEGGSPCSGGDYHEYGGYLVDRGDDHVRAAVDREIRKRVSVLEHLPGVPQGARVLDFGSGAGYFCRGARERGFAACGLEVSSRLRSYSQSVVGVTEVHGDLRELDGEFDVVTMFDVIEHIGVSDLHDVMGELARRISVGGHLFGYTPNVESLNLKVGRERDPVIAPPMHVAYFSPRTLDRCLRRFGLRKVSLVTRGFSPNCFVRSSKFKRSAIEDALAGPLGPMKAVALAVFAAGRAVGHIGQLFGAGYQIRFVYRKENSPR